MFEQLNKFTGPTFLIPLIQLTQLEDNTLGVTVQKLWIVKYAAALARAF